MPWPSVPTACLFVFVLALFDLGFLQMMPTPGAIELSYLAEPRR
jgi:hypothetical protein